MKQSLYLDDEEEPWPEAEQDEEPDPLDPFFADGTVTEVVGELKSGKEGTVYVCCANPSTGVELLAAKVYRSRALRNFKNDAVYSEGRSFGKARENRAVKNKSVLGREIQYGAWLNHEWETLRTLSAAGAAVPRPYARAGSAILMEYIGDAGGAAPPLQHVRLASDEVRPLLTQALDTIELFLRHNCVHADLSPYNILYRPGQLTIIDFPQAVDPRINGHALDLLLRDVHRVCTYFMRYGVQMDPGRIARHLWSRFLRMDL
jgi:RIO kinase 1